MRLGQLLVACILLSGLHSAPALALQCVPFAREASGIDLRGNAWQWWRAADGRYQRGSQPRDGAVMVFSRQGSMSHGHVAVVTRVVSNRLVLIDHANWAPAGSSERGRVDLSVPVLDVSAANDWSRVRVWYRPVDDYGNTVYATDGFVYAQAPASSSSRPHDIERHALVRASAILAADEAARRPVVSEHLLSRPSLEGMVIVGRHSFRPRDRQETVFNPARSGYPGGHGDL